MKIGILTYHHVNNDGAILQTLGHVYTLQSLYPDATIEVIDYRSLNMEISEWIAVLKPIIKRKDNGFSKLRKLLRLKAFVKNNIPLSPKRLVSNNWIKASAFIEKQKYDVVIVGSDEVWKILNTRWSRKFPNIYWLPLPLGAKKIASAASANKSNESLIGNENVQQQLKKFLDDFYSIAVRDQFSFDLAKKYVSDPSKVYQVPDPTFGTEFNIDMSKKLAALGVDFSRKVLALSFSSNPVLFSKISRDIRAYADENNIQLVAIGQQNKYAHLDLTNQLNPLEWASSYKHFNFCITDRFHSAIFSIKNTIPFMVIELSSKYEGSYKGKIVDLLSKCGMMEAHHFIKDGNYDIIHKMNELTIKHNPDNMRKIVSDLNHSFRKHLTDSISNAVKS